MEIKNFIRIYDEVIPWTCLSSLLRFSNTHEFDQARVGGGPQGAKVDFNIRRTWTLPLSNSHDSMTNVHWFNYLAQVFDIKLKQYIDDLKIDCLIYTSINDVSILKYENTGFYTWHSDHFFANPRTMSCILLLNNDYEGGNICFRNPDKSGEFSVDVKPNRLIIWPSCFMFPHTVKPVTKGTRFSVVGWAL